MTSFTGWRFLVNFLLPPPMVLTFLLVLPFPRNVRKGLLLFTNSVLSLSVLGGLKFVHLALILSGVPLIDSGFRTFKIGHEAADHELTPNQRISVLAKKWREERNFWIAAMAFTLWCLLTVLYAQVTRSMRVQDRLDEVQAELDELKGVKPPAPPSSKMRVAGAVAALVSALGMGVPAPLAHAAGGRDAAAGRPAATAHGDAAGRFGWGKKAKEEDDEGPQHSGNATGGVEMTSPAGAATEGPTTRRRAAAATAASQE